MIICKRNVQYVKSLFLMLWNVKFVAIIFAVAVMSYVPNAAEWSATNMYGAFINIAYALIVFRKN